MTRLIVFSRLISNVDCTSIICTVFIEITLNSQIIGDSYYMDSSTKTRTRLWSNRKDSPIITCYRTIFCEISINYRIIYTTTITNSTTLIRTIIISTIIQDNTVWFENTRNISINYFFLETNCTTKMITTILSDISKIIFSEISIYNGIIYCLSKVNCSSFSLTVITNIITIKFTFNSSGSNLITKVNSTTRN